MHDDLLSHFLGETQKYFQFLIDEHSFRGPKVKIYRPITEVRYSRSKLAVVVEWDEKDQYVDCHVVRLLPGRLMFSWWLAGDVVPWWLGGGRCRNLDDLLDERARRRGTPAPPPAQLGGLSPREQLSGLLHEYATNLKNYGADILADSPNALSSS
jgi:hypothetical protein